MTSTQAAISTTSSSTAVISGANRNKTKEGKGIGRNTFRENRMIQTQQQQHQRAVQAQNTQSRRRNNRGIERETFHVMSSRQHHDQHPRSSSHGSRAARATPTFNKDTYMAAHYHYELSIEGSGCESLIDPDVLVPWQHVEQVVCTVESIRLCPICLDAPIAAKITRCGHIFCLPCILRYLSLSSFSWSRCPLCFEPVYPQALKSLRFLIADRMSVGSNIELTLLKRRKDSIVAYEVLPAPLLLNSSSSTSDSKHSLSNSASSHALSHNSFTCPSLFSRVTFVLDISSICQRELTELATYAEACDQDDFQLQYIRMSEECIFKKLEGWADSKPQFQQKAKEIMANTLANRERAKNANEVRLKAASEEANRKIQNSKAKFSMDSDFPSLGSTSASVTPLSSQIPTKPILSLKPISSSPKPEPFSPVTNAEGTQDGSSNLQQPGNTSELSAVELDWKQSDVNRISKDELTSHYFTYQSRDGQQIYLHALNYRCLMAEYGGVDRLPPQLSAKILYLDDHHLDQAARDKFRFLSHLPITSPFQVAFLDLSPMLSEATLARFAGDIANEKRNRDQKAKRSEKIAQEQERVRELERLRDASPSYSNQFASTYVPAYHLESFTIADTEAFPSLQAASTSPTSNSPSTPDASSNNRQWNIVAERGLAASSTWAALGQDSPVVESGFPTLSYPVIDPALTNTNRLGGGGKPRGKRNYVRIDL